jgi:uncharacterized protein YkwD
MRSILPSNFYFIKVILVISCLFSVSGAAALEEIPAEGVLAEMNLARTDPLQYAGFLQELRKQFQGDSYTPAGTNIVLRTKEGIVAVDEAITYLSARKALPPLLWSAGLAAAAAELVEEQGKSGITGHNGLKGDGLLVRVKRQGIGETRLGENIAYGFNTPRAVVMALIIDDGVPRRGHRENQFDASFTKAGVSCGFHPYYDIFCAIDFSD